MLRDVWTLTHCRRGSASELLVWAAALPGRVAKARISPVICFSGCMTIVRFRSTALQWVFGSVPNDGRPLAVQTCIVSRRIVRNGKVVGVFTNHGQSPLITFCSKHGLA